MAEYRKIIGFGKHSSIITLPKRWTEQHNLKPGDSVLIDVLTNNIIITPGKTFFDESEQKIIVIETDEEIETSILRFRIIDAYINNADKIIIKGSKVSTIAKTIREIINELMALEIIEASTDKITAECYLNMKEVSVLSLLRKIDNIIKSMLIDLEAVLKKDNKFKEFDLKKDIEERDKDINRITYLILRTVKYSLENPYLLKSKIGKPSLLSIWDMAKNMELIGDNIKELTLLSDLIPEKSLDNIALLIKRIAEDYSEMTRAYFKNDKEKAIKLFKKKKFCEEKAIINNDDKTVMIVDEHLKTICLLISRIAYLFE